MTIPRPGLRDHVRLARMAGDIGGLLDELHGRWGPIVDIGHRFPLRMVYAFGPEANRRILADRPDAFRWGEALRALAPVNGPTALVLTDGAEHDRRRRLVQPAFARRRIDAQAVLVATEIDRMLDQWTAGRSLDAFADGRATVRRIVTRTQFGPALAAQADRLGELLEPAIAFANGNPLTRIDRDLRFNAHGRARRARREVDVVIRAEIGRRRRDETEADAPDILSALLEADVDGDQLDDAEICDQVVSLIAAGYDTTSSAFAWLVFALGSHPTVLDQLATEVRDTIGSAAPTSDDLRQMPMVDAVVRETLRLWPPGSVGVRHATEDIEVLGHLVPAGRMIAYSPYVTHRLADVWDDPTSFRPDRWTTGGGEPVPYAYVPFGGGKRNCIGFALASLELQVFACRLAQRVRWQVDTGEPTSSAVASFAPDGGMPITVT